ncbi:ML-236A carboxylate methylbutanoyltransferase mlcH [Metarhizium brunneum]|uniref:ML-236A carboxylate methylbutanoyltransferase mlcH n=1 Tax=Metarhizium brunneum TaxID=500148 RepID=A0A7D5Z1F0_9HYPO|nr:ML-236A carboxylate methylbutanoyltransferase mlcH [Metarhizium brunneum]
MNRLDDILRRYTVQGEDTKDRLLGAAFVVTDKEGTIYTGSSGRLDLDPKSPLFTERSFTWVASLTKLATTISILQLVERGQLDLDADLRHLIPELRDASILHEFDENDNPVIEANAKPITMRQLLTHTSGFSYEFSDPVLLQWSRTQPNRNVSRLQWSKLEVTTPLRFAPGQSWGYGVGLDWAGQVLEALTGKSLGQYMQENILDPVGLNDTGFWPERIPHTAPRTAQNVQRTKDGKLAAALWPTPEKHEIESGGGGWFTTASDYALFLRAFLAGRLVSEETMREMVKPQLNEAQAEFLRTIAFHPMVHNTFAPEFKPGTNIDHGLGGMLNVEDVPGKRKAGSIAWSGILNSRWWVDPKTGIAGVLIVNVRPNGDPIVAKLYDELELALYGQLLGQGAVQSRI